MGTMKRWITRLVSALLILGAISIAVVSYSLHVEPRWVEVVQLEESLPRLSPAFDGFKIAHISDLHVGRFMNKDRFTELMALVNQQAPDLVVITGDFVTHHPDRYADSLIQGLRLLSDQQMTLGVLGNHVYWSDPVEVRRILQASNVLEL